MSFVNATLVLSIGETVEEVTDSGFLGTTPTLSCSLLGDDALVQVMESCFLQTCLPLSACCRSVISAVVQHVSKDVDCQRRMLIQPFLFYILLSETGLVSKWS